MNQIGYIDLGARETSTAQIPEEMLRKYLGGRGLGAYLLYNHVPKGIDPLSPENALIFSSGFLSGVFASGYGRLHITGKSPDTGIYGDSNIGGDMAAELKYAGFQNLVIKGKSDRPTYIYVHDGDIEVRDASHLWGMDTYETQLRLWDDLQDPDAKIACIGQAGERLVRFACIRSWMKRAAGRTGQGCLMGSKNLKAVVVRGTGGMPVAHPEKLLQTAKAQYEFARKTKIFQINSRWSNLFAWVVNNEREGIVVRNHQANFYPEGYGHLDVDIFLDKYSEKMLACHSCAMHCQHRYKIKEGPYAGTEGEGPEWIVPLLYGAFIGNVDYDVALYSLELLNQYGVDAATAGLYIGWLMHCWQEGLITEKDTGGLNLEWGNREAIIGLIKQMAFKEGLGGMVTDGSDEAIRRLGPETAQYLYRCGKGLTQEPGNDRMLRATPLGNVTSNRGNDHLRGRVNLEFMNLPAEVLQNIFGRPVNPEPTAWDTKAWMATWQQYLNTMSDATGLCKFWTQWFAPDMWGFKQPTEVINAVTGWDMTPEELMETSERIWNMEKMFNHREGVGREGDKPPHIFFEPVKEGARKGLRLEPDKWEALLDEYYELHGWDKEGTPQPETLKRLGLDQEPSHRL
ncbi:MAG: aldehyde ferredoxin oxidoreductase family protein [Dehalococcoidia bacterium]